MITNQHVQQHTHGSHGSVLLRNAPLKPRTQGSRRSPERRSGSAAGSRPGCSFSAAPATTRTQRPGQSHAVTGQSGMLLVECLVYLSCLFAVLGVAMAVFFQVLEFSRGLRRNAEDITRVLQAGERWRADVRAATGRLTLEEGASGRALHIALPDGRVSYLFTTNAVMRCTERPGRCETVLPAAKECRFTREARLQVTSWRWEVELPSRLKAVRIHPLFTFTAVSSREALP